MDDEDYEWLSQWKWHRNETSQYACRTKHYKDGTSEAIFMHKEIVSVSDEYEVDHKNRNKIDNRKENLRIATRSNNMANREKFNGDYTSMYKGVSWNKRLQSWVSYCANNYIGIFSNEIAAANAYNHYAKELFGEFSLLNNCPHMENWREYQSFPTSNFYGVSWSNYNQKWVSYINYQGKKKTLGYFDNELQAANCYNFWCSEYYGEHAKLNNCEIVEWKKEERKLTSKFHGVCWNKQEEKWMSYIRNPITKKQQSLGRYKNEIDASIAYNKVAIEFYGQDYVMLNILN